MWWRREWGGVRPPPGCRDPLEVGPQAGNRPAQLPSPAPSCIPRISIAGAVRLPSDTAHPGTPSVSIRAGPIGLLEDAPSGLSPQAGMCRAQCPPPIVVPITASSLSLSSVCTSTTCPQPVILPTESQGPTEGTAPGSGPQAGRRLAQLPSPAQSCTPCTSIAGAVRLPPCTVPSGTPSISIRATRSSSQRRVSSRKASSRAANASSVTGDTVRPAAGVGTGQARPRHCRHHCHSDPRA